MGIVSAQDLNDNSDSGYSLSDNIGESLDEESVCLATDDNFLENDLASDVGENPISSENEVNVFESDDNPAILEDDEEIMVNDWDELKYYCSLEDRNYTLKLKENTNFYPLDGENSSYQIVIRNNVTIIGSEGAYIGDSSPDAQFISYAPMLTEDDSGIGVHIENVTFKWIATRYGNEGVFLTMGGNTTNLIKNCYFYNITTTTGHSAIVYIKRGDAALENCTFLNCSNSFGCVSIYDPRDDPSGVCTSARMTMDNSYFEGNFASVEPGCINNCGVLIVTNTTFHNNSAYWWAGAIHTHGGANTTIYDCNFTNNTAGWNGGALYTYSWLQIFNSTFKGNKCLTNNGGGAIGACWYAHSPFIHIEETLFEDNENACWEIGGDSTTGTGRGGAISIMDDGLLEVYNSTFIKNSASIGTAICALEIDYSGKHSPLDVKLIGNKFINHTRVGDVLDICVNSTSTCIIQDNYYLNNSIEFSKLNLTYSETDGIYYFNIDANLSHPKSYDEDILDKCSYDLYLNGTYFKTINDTNFTLNNIDKTNVYVIPSIGSKSSNILYFRVNSTVSIDVSDIEYGENQIIRFPVDPSDATGNLTVLVNNKTYELKLTRPILNLDNLPAGEYNVSVTYNGNLEYYPSVNNTSFIVKKKVLDVDVMVDESNVSVQLPVDAKGTLSLVIGDETYTKNLVNGSTTIKIFSLNSGTYHGTATYSGDENYDGFKKNITLTLNDFEYGVSVNGSDVSIKLPADAKGTFSLMIDEKTITKILSNGGATIKMSGLSPGTYHGTATYSGDENYDSFRKNITMIINGPAPTPTKVATKLTAPKVTATYNVAKKLVITLKDAKGKVLANKKVTVKVGTIIKTLKTNNKGQVSLNVATLVPKTYTATVKFAGDSSYKASTLKPKVVVKKAKPKLAAKARIFKAKAKVKKFTATLKNNKGKVMKNTKLTLKVNKKTFTVKTNKKGVATFKINDLNKKGKYTALIKFAGNKYFTAISKKVKINVKK